MCGRSCCDVSSVRSQPRISQVVVPSFAILTYSSFSLVAPFGALWIRSIFRPDGSAAFLLG
jgi:hypothetical protein